MFIYIYIYLYIYIYIYIYIYVCMYICIYMAFYGHLNMVTFPSVGASVTFSNILDNFHH